MCIAFIENGTDPIENTYYGVRVREKEQLTRVDHKYPTV
jgi:hypothetical protein